MAQPALVKPLVLSIFHLKRCKAEKPEECKECVEAATRIAAIFTEVMEVAEVVRRWHREIQAAMPK